MISMLDIEGTNRVRYEEFHKFATGKALAPIGIALPPSINLLQKNITKEGEEDLKIENFKSNKRSKMNKARLEEINEDNEGAG